MTERCITLIPETPFEDDAVRRVLRHGGRIESKALDHNWPPQREALVLALPDPNDWGT